MNREWSPREALARPMKASGDISFRAPQKFSRMSVAAEIWELLPVCLECIDLRGFVIYRNPAARIEWALTGKSDRFVAWMHRWSADSRVGLRAAMLQAQTGSRCRVFADRLLAAQTERYQVTLTPQMRSQSCWALLAVSVPVRTMRTPEMPRQQSEN